MPEATQDITPTLAATRARYLTPPKGYAGPAVVRVAYNSPKSELPSYMRYDDGGVLYFVSVMRCDAHGQIVGALSVQARPNADGSPHGVTLTRDMSIDDAMESMQSGILVEEFSERSARTLACGLLATMDSLHSTTAEQLDALAVRYIETAYGEHTGGWATPAEIHAAAAADDLSIVGDALAATA